MNRLQRVPAIVWLAAALGLGLALRTSSLDLPLDRDEGELMSLGWLWRTGHSLPYLDHLELKPPLGIGLAALADALFSDGVHGLRLLSLAWQLATLALFFALLRRGAARGCFGEALASAPAAFAGLASLAFALLSNAARVQGLAANTESWQGLPLLAGAAILLLAPPRPGAGALLAAGLALGLASLFKQTALLAPFFFAAAGPRLAERLRCAAWLAAGVGLIWAAAWTVFAMDGAGGALLANTLGYGARYSGSGQAGAMGRAVGLALWLAPEQAGAWGLAGLGCAAVLASQGGRLLLAWLAWSLAALVLGGRYYPHYAQALLLPMAALAARGLLLGRDGWLEAEARPLGRGLRAAALAALAAGAAWSSWGIWNAPDGAVRSSKIYGLDTFAAARRVADKVAAWSGPKDRVFLWGADAELFYLARRRPASRFLYHYPFDGSAPAWPEGEAELLAGLLDPRTRVAVLSAPLDTANAFQRRLALALAQHYHVEEELPGFVLGRRIR